MKNAICVICQGIFFQDQPWKDRCKPCFIKTLGTKKRETFQHESTVRTVYVEVERPIPLEMINRMIRLCHPDKHNNSEVSNQVTAWLIDQRKEAMEAGQNG